MAPSRGRGRAVVTFALVCGLASCARPVGSASPRAPHHRVAKGDPYGDNCDDPKSESCLPQCAADEEVHAVRCCSETPRDGWAEMCEGLWQHSDAWGGCRELPFAEAAAFCAGQGARLCTEAEVQRRCVRATGCRFDTRLIWTQDACAESLSSGGEVFVLSAFSHDDTVQRGLIAAWMRHYTHALALNPENYLCILHSDSKNYTGLSRLARQFQEEFGVIHTFHVTEPYSSKLHWRIKLDILLEHVSARDWVIQVDADEMVFFPFSRLPIATLDNLDALGYDVVYGLMIDRVAANGDLDQVVDRARSPFQQFPLNCMLTLMWQESDVRKAVAYRGYLRTTSGNHNTLSVKWNGTCAPPRSSPRLNAHRERVVQAAMERIQPGLYRRLPYAALGRIPDPKPMQDFASVYHFKWIAGVAEKLNRRASTEAYTVSQYKRARVDLKYGNRLKPDFLEYFCKTGELVGVERALRAREMLHLFFAMKPAHFDHYCEQAGVEKAEEDLFLADKLQWLMAQTLHHEELS